MDHPLRTELVGLLPRLRRFARRLAGAEDEADDIVQEACERALRRAEQWTPGTRLDSWMFRIVHTVRIDRARARRVRGEHLAPVDPDALIGGDLRDSAEARLTLASVRQTMAQLPEEQRAAILLVCVEGLSYREAADALGVPVGTIMSRLSRGRQALMKMLEPPTRIAATASMR